MLISRQLTMFGIGGIILAVVASSLASVPLSDIDKKDMVFFLGRWFHKNGRPKPTQFETPPQLFSQCVNHFNLSGGACENQWSQRFWVREDFYKPGGPIFFHFGGQDPADDLIDNYYWHNHAQHHNAMLVVLEHRFYGESYPSRDTTLEVLELFTSQQALADAAYFIDNFNGINGLNGSNWVAFGGSYSAALAAWMKQKYPNHIKTAVASSPPLVPQYNYPGFVETLSEIVKVIDPDCHDKVYDAFACMESLVNGSTCGNYTSPSQIIPGLQQCESVDFGNLLDRETFFFSISMDLWGNNWPSEGIRRNCKILERFNGTDPIGVYGNFIVETGSGGGCTIRPKKDVKEEFLKFIRSEEGKAAGAAGWFWQTCYEFGFYMGADPKNGLFGYDTFSGWVYGAACESEFGPRFTREYTESRIAMTNEYYKGLDIDSNCVIFINGEWDPWHKLSIIDPSQTTPNNTVVFIPRSEHCDDMLDPKSEDIRKAQAIIQEQIGIYLNNPNC